MSQSRFFYAGPIQTGDDLVLNREHSHRAITVLRHRLGDKLILFNGDGYDYLAELTHIQKKQVVVTVHRQELTQSESPLFIELAQGISQTHKMDYALQKSVELGVSSLTPLLTQYCSISRKSLTEKKIEHWRALVIAACEQSGRSKLPEINGIEELAAWAQNKRDGLRLVCHPYAPSGLQAILSNIPTKLTRVSVAIGPEGGFSDNDIEILLKNGFTPFSLGKRIVRTETAPVVVLSLLQFLWGDLG